jgi:hypothetical protein
MIHHPSSFSIKTHTADEEKIKRMELGNCIQTYMLNPIVRDTAERAGWLGNDETHYLRKWEEKDLQDLKDLSLPKMLSGANAFEISDIERMNIGAHPPGV